MYWTAAQLEPHRTHVALHFLELAGYKTYLPQIRAHRVRLGRRIEIAAPLFPGYCFVLIELQWHAARWAVGTRGLVMDGSGPARCPDRVIAELKARERGGLVDLPCRFRRGDRVRIVGGRFAGHVALYAGMKPRERVEVLLQLLSGAHRVELARDHIACAF
jgi:transcriptional antiterminator RfaH